MSTMDTEVRLDEDITSSEGTFQGGNLNMNDADANANPPAGFAQEVAYSGSGIQRDRPFSASTMSRHSTTTTGSQTSLQAHKVMTPFAMESMFCYKQGAFESAVEKCQQELLKNDVDGALEGAWILAEIDHWDNEREKLVLLTTNSVLVVRYDFIAHKIRNAHRIVLHVIEKLQIGDLVYPPRSLMPTRNHGGIRLIWGNTDSMSFGQRWNPFSSDIPFTTFCHHPNIYSEKERETVIYNVDDFFESLKQSVNKAYRVMKPTVERVTVEEMPITIQSYASLSSTIFNQSHIGFNRERGGVSF